MSDDTAWLKYIISEIADVAPWSDRSPAHAAAHIRNLILNLKTEAAVQRKLHEAAMQTVKDMVGRCKWNCTSESSCETCCIAFDRHDLDID